MPDKELTPVPRIESLILRIRGQNVILDNDLAVLYGVEARSLIQAVSRNRERFPSDFMFQLTKKDAAFLKSQFVMSKGRGGRRTNPYTFTEQGVAMLSSVLRSPRAIQVNIEIMRTFVKIRQILSSHKELQKRLDTTDRKLDEHDEQFQLVFDAIRELMAPPKRKQRRIGFQKD